MTSKLPVQPLLLHCSICVSSTSAWRITFLRVNTGHGRFDVAVALLYHRLVVTLDLGLVARPRTAFLKGHDGIKAALSSFPGALCSNIISAHAGPGQGFEKHTLMRQCMNLRCISLNAR